MSRYHPFNGYGGYEQSLYNGQGSSGYGPQSELNSMSFGDSSAYHHHNVGRISQNVYDQGLLSPMQLGSHNPAQNYYAQGRAQHPAHPYRHQHHPRHHYGRHPHNQGHRHANGDGNGQGDSSNQHYQDTKYDKTYDSATYAAGDAKGNAKVVAQVARSMGVDPATAIAAMLVESGGNAHAIGDHGTSFGLFQLHRGGELGKMSPQQAFNPEANARVALSYFKKGEQQNPGAMVAAAQRPADRAGYARQVNARMAQARRLLQEVENS